MCDLCNISSEIIFNEGSFFSIICRGCKIPMIVLKHHRKELDDCEKMEFMAFAAKYYPGYKQRKIGMREILDHWHEHLIRS